MNVVSSVGGIIGVGVHNAFTKGSCVAVSVLKISVGGSSTAGRVGMAVSRNGVSRISVFSSDLFVSANKMGGGKSRFQALLGG